MDSKFDMGELLKTYSATGVMDKLAEKFWEKNKDKPFVVFYIGPNSALLKKCCDDIIDKSAYKDKIVYMMKSDDEILKDYLKKEREEIYHNYVKYKREGGSRFPLKKAFHKY